MFFVVEVSDTYLALGNIGSAPILGEKEISVYTKECVWEAPIAQSN